MYCVFLQFRSAQTLGRVGYLCGALWNRHQFHVGMKSREFVCNPWFDATYMRFRIDDNSSVCRGAGLMKDFAERPSR